MQYDNFTIFFLRDSFCLSAVSLSRQRHDILDFSYCPLSRVLHVTLANWQRFGFEFIWGHHHPHLVGMDNRRSTDYFITCYTVLTRLNKVETAVHGWLSVWTLLCLSLASLFSSLSIFCWSDLLQMLRIKQASFSFAVGPFHPQIVRSR